jgi:UDP:flavonoid glycosyltransferase YjiC (YdhE family)
MLGALSHGIPLVIPRFAADEPENAERYVAAGVGLVLPASEPSPDTARAVVMEVFGRPDLPATGGESSSGDRGYASAGKVVLHLERLARR